MRLDSLLVVIMSIHLCAGPDATLSGFRAYSCNISRRMASRGKMVLSLGNTLEPMQCYKTKTIQGNKILFMDGKWWVVPFSFHLGCSLS